MGRCSGVVFKELFLSAEELHGTWPLLPQRFGPCLLQSIGWPLPQGVITATICRSCTPICLPCAGGRPCSASVAPIIR